MSTFHKMHLSQGAPIHFIKKFDTIVLKNETRFPKTGFPKTILNKYTWKCVPDDKIIVTKSDDSIFAENVDVNFTFPYAGFFNILVVDTIEESDYHVSILCADDDAEAKHIFANMDEQYFA